MRFLGWGGSDQPGEAVNSIVAGGVIAIVRLPSADVLVPAAEAIREGGVTAVEVTPTTPGAVQASGPARVKLGRGVVLGVGTVLTADAARDAIRAGAAAVGVGDEIVSKDLLAQREFSEITRRARAFAEAVQRARGQVEHPAQPVRPIEGPDTR
jgi:2-keto-3-deoxy-6-phosphogluconate aldolase